MQDARRKKFLVDCSLRESKLWDPNRWSPDFPSLLHFIRLLNFRLIDVGWRYCFLLDLEYIIDYPFHPHLHCLTIARAMENTLGLRFIQSNRSICEIEFTINTNADFQAFILNCASNGTDSQTAECIFEN